MNASCEQCWKERHIRCEGDGCTCTVCAGRRSGMSWAASTVERQQSKAPRPRSTVAQEYSRQGSTLTCGSRTNPTAKARPVPKLSSVRAVVLQALIDNPDVTSHQVARLTGKTRTQMATLLTRLVDAGLVIVTLDNDDLRSRQYHVAPGYVLDGKILPSALTKHVPLQHTSREVKHRGPNGERTGIGGADSKFTAQQMREIQAQLEFTSISELARQYQCARKTIYRVRDHQFTNVRN